MHTNSGLDIAASGSSSLFSLCTKSLGGPSSSSSRYWCIIECQFPRNGLVLQSTALIWALMWTDRGSLSSPDLYVAKTSSPRVQPGVKRRGTREMFSNPVHKMFVASLRVGAPRDTGYFWRGSGRVALHCIFRVTKRCSTLCVEQDQDREGQGSTLVWLLPPFGSRLCGSSGSIAEVRIWTALMAPRS